MARPLMENEDHDSREAGLGRHLLAEFYGCGFSKLNDSALLRKSALIAVQSSGATVVGSHFKKFEPHGVSGVVVIAESHLSLHTWPEHGYMAIDYFTCSPRVNIDLAIDLLAEVLQPARVHRSLHWRGRGLAAVPGLPDGPGVGDSVEVAEGEGCLGDGWSEQEKRETHRHDGARSERSTIGKLYPADGKIVAGLKSKAGIGMKRVRIFSHHLYELKKGLRNLILFTTDKENQAAIELKLQSHSIAYLVCPVSSDSNKINIFFGNKICIEVIKQFEKPYLSELSAEEDFILGTMLGYARLKQCERYLRVKGRKDRALSGVKRARP